MAQDFEAAYPDIRRELKAQRYGNVLFNLDPYGDSHVRNSTLQDIMNSFSSAEIFYTFMIAPLVAFLSQKDPDQIRNRLSHLGISDLSMLEKVMGRDEWLGTAEKIVFENFQHCARYVSPFSINNPDGWRYWLIHFSNMYRARQVYNNVLHNNASLQAHFGRSGLQMLSYDPRHDDGKLYLFSEMDRIRAKNQLLDDIPRLVAESGDVMPVAEFYSRIYNATPAHADDINAAIIDSPDLEVITPLGGGRRKANTIDINDEIKLKNQKNFFSLLK